MPRVTITAPDKNPQPYRFQLDRQVVSMGRAAGNDIVIRALPSAASVPFGELRDEVVQCLARRAA